MGRVLWTCRTGFEGALYEELAWAGAMPSVLGPALVEADPRPGPAPAFGRMGFHSLFLLDPDHADPTQLASRLQQAARGRPLAIEAWALDTSRAQPMSGQAEVLGQAVRGALGGDVTPEEASETGGLLGQVCLVDRSMMVLGIVAAREAVSLAPGGRRRMHRGPGSPSRAAMKLDEALDGLRFSPGKGDVCVDLGAAPGGWTQRLVARGARVIAVDPANLSRDLRDHPKVRHVQESAFRFEPEEPVDWLFCDMAWRPLEVAQLLAKWGRHNWALHLVANIKLPMKDKNAMLFRVRHLLSEEGGWQELRMRQLYHDRDEVTLTARRVA